MGGINQIGIQHAQLDTVSRETSKAAKDGVSVQVNGQTITTQPNQQSLLQQAARDSFEEITMAFQDKSADNLKRRDAKSRHNSRASKLLRKYLKAVDPTRHAEKFSQMAENLRKLKNATPGDIRNLVGKFRQESDDDLSEAGLLMALEEMCAADGVDPKTLEALRTVKADLGKQLQKFQNDAQQFAGFSETYDKLLGDYGDQDFLAATNKLIGQHGAEVQNEGSAADMTKVKATLDCLYNLEVARNTYMDVSKLVVKTNATLANTSA